MKQSFLVSVFVMLIFLAWGFYAMAHNEFPFAVGMWGIAFFELLISIIIYIKIKSHTEHTVR